MNKNSKAIKYVQKGSIAEEAGLEPGDVILSVNGEPINDIFDYSFLTIDDEITLEVYKSNDIIWEIDIYKDEYEDLGIEFYDPMLDDAKGCTNKCIFCFIDQLPPGMRETLYFKDDDSRLSFLMGNYVTLTNTTWEEIFRIKKHRMSPINISVHTTNPDLRCLMLRNKFAGDIIKKIKSLTSSGITVNCQIVLLRGVNDGEELDRSIHDLCLFHPGIGSVSIVPVGITKYRQKLSELTPYDKSTSRRVIEQVEKWQKKLKSKKGSNIIFLADEFYIMADLPLPRYEDYEGFPQLENGVGMIALFRYEFYEYLKQNLKPKKADRVVSVATGRASYKYIKEFASCLEDKFSGIRINVYEIKNEFFGENVTVTGLLTGQDLFRQLSGCDLGEELLLSKSVLKAGEELFLDDFTVAQLEEKLDVKVVPVNSTAKDFVDYILEIN